MPASPLIKSIKDIEAIEQTSWRDECPFESTYAAIKNSASKNPEHPALMFLPTGSAEDTPHSISYGELLTRITQTANLFYELGVQSTDIVSYILPNFPETHDVIWGAETTGIVNAINPFLEPKTIQKLLSAARSKIVVTFPPLPGLDLWTALIPIFDELDCIETILYVDYSNYYGGSPLDLPKETPLGKPIIRFQDARDAQNGEDLNSTRVIKPDDIASLFHTGGTTGTPKLAPHTHENEVFTSWAVSKVIPFNPEDKALVGLPLFHVNAVLATGLSTFVSGATQILAGPMGFRGPGVISSIWKTIDRFKVASMSGVPTVYSAMMSIPKDGLDLSSFRFAAVGAAPLSPELFRSFIDYSGVQLLEGYGLTESTVVATTNPLGGEKRVGSIGLRLPYLEMKCAKLDAHGEVERFCEPNEVGTIIIRGPAVFPGYYMREDNGLSSDGWLNTGDLGTQDEDEYFWITGRSKDVIIRGGHNIDPSMIENTLEEHEAVALVAAIGQPDDYAGEVPAAYVQLNEGADIDADALKDWVKSRIPERAAAPVYLEIMDTLPVTAVGKIHKPPLRLIATERVLFQKLEATGLPGIVRVENDSKGGLVATIETDFEQELKAAFGNFPVKTDIRPTRKA